MSSTQGTHSARSSGPADAQPLSEVLAAYVQAVEAGSPPDRDALLRARPDLAEELREFFAEHDRMRQLAEPFRPSGTGRSSSAQAATAALTSRETPPAPPETVPMINRSAGPRRDAEHTDDAAATRVVDTPSREPDPTTGDPRKAGHQPGASGDVRPAFGPGASFGDYELLEEIARGGMGVVYKARQTGLNRTVALKMILAGQLASDEEVQRFYREAEAAATLDHPGIVPVYEVGCHAGHHFFSMGFVDGASLAEILRRGPLAPREAADIVRQVAEAVQFAHEHGVIHRDLKPANILLARTRAAGSPGDTADAGRPVWAAQPKVTDFGLAKKLETDANLTGTGQILGTPNYMAPEQASGHGQRVGPAADVYALGAVLYHLLCGHPPFASDSVMQTLVQVIEREPVPPRQINPRIARDLETICLKCLEKDPQRRYALAAELAGDLRHYLEGEAIRARPTTWIERWRRWLWRKRRLTAIVAGAAVAAAILVVGVLLVWETFRRSAIETRAGEFVDAVRAADRPGLEHLLTQRARQNRVLEMLGAAEELSGVGPDDYSIGAATVAGDEAHVPVVVNEAGGEYRLDLRLRREAGEWRVYDINLRKRGFQLATNLESPAAQFLFGPDGGAAPEPQPLEAIDVAALTSAWQREFRIADEPAGEALDRLVQPLGLTLVRRSDQQAVLAQPVTLAREGSSPLEVVEELCGQIGMHPRYRGNRLTLADGPRPFPVAFAGPFLVEVADVKQFAPYATGRATLHVRAYGLPEAVVRRFHDRFEKVEIERVVDAGGRDLHDPDGPSPGSAWSRQETAIEYPVVVPLRNLLQSVEAIAELQGSIALELPTRVESLTFDELRTGTSQTAGDLRVTLQPVGGGQQPTLQFDFAGIEEAKDVQVLAYDETGRVMSETSSFGFGTSRHLTFSRLPDHAIVRFAAEVQPVELVFRLEQVPLADAATMPAELVPARFPGHDAPVTVEFVEVAERSNFTRVRLRAVNHSDQAIRKLEMRHVYVDGQGRPLKDFPSSHSASDGDGRPPVIVGPNAAAEFVDSAFFMPEEATAVRVTVRRVTFADATGWAPGGGPAAR